MIQTNTQHQQTKNHKKIKFEEWVYKNLFDFGNCALPNWANDFDKKELEEHLSQKTGLKIVVRVADFVKTESTQKKLEINQHYYIAEEKK